MSIKQYGLFDILFLFKPAEPDWQDGISGILPYYFIFAPHLGQTGFSLFAWQPQLLQMQDGSRFIPPKQAGFSSLSCIHLGMLKPVESFSLLAVFSSSVFHSSLFSIISNHHVFLSVEVVTIILCCMLSEYHLIVFLRTCLLYGDHWASWRR